MPAGTYDQRNVQDGYRRCPRCGSQFPATADYFYARSNGTLELCRGTMTNNCRAEYFRRYAEVKRGTGSNRKFGCEIEFCGRYAALAAEMTRLGLPCEYEGYNHEVKRTWKIVSDSSVDGGAELVSPPLRGDRGRQQIRTACQALANVGATVNSSTGLHVHHEAKNLTLDQFKRLFRFWYSAQPYTALLIAKSRRLDNGYCYALNDADMRTVDNLRDMQPHNVGALMDGSRGRYERYRNLSTATSFPNYGTVEVRWHQGTVNAQKILAWVEYVQSIFTFAMSTAPVPDFRAAEVTEMESLGDVLTFLAVHGLSDDTAAYLTERAAALASAPDRPARRHVCEDCGCIECECYDEDTCPSCDYPESVCRCCSECCEYPCSCESSDPDYGTADCHCSVCADGRNAASAYNAERTNV